MVPSTTLKTTVLAPIPTAMVTMMTSEKPGDRRRVFKVCRNRCMDFSRVRRGKHLKCRGGEGETPTAADSA